MFSWSKIYKFFERENIQVVKVYVISVRPIFVECVFNADFQPFLIDLSRTNVEIDSYAFNNIPVVKIVEYDYPNMDNFDYVKSLQPDRQELLKEYNDRNMNVDTGEVDDESYNVNIEFDKIDLELDLKISIHQLKRYKLCVEKLPYKLIMFSNRWILNVNKYSEIEPYKILPSEKVFGEQKYILVTINLERLYNEYESVPTELKSIEKGLLATMESNQHKSLNNINRLIQHNSSMFSYWTKLENKKLKIKKNLEDLSHLSVINTQTRMKLESEIHNIKERREQSGNAVGRGFKQEVDEIDKLYKLDSRLRRVKHTQREIIQKYNAVWKRLQKLICDGDKVMFNSNTLIYHIVKNLDELKEISY